MSIIIIDSLSNTNVYVEKKNKLFITANNIKNNDGILRIDDEDNQLISKIDSGYTPLYRVKEYNYDDYLMLYNQTTKQIQLAKTESLLHIPIDFALGTKYFLGANRHLVSNHKENVYSVDLKESNIFKIYLDNGIEITNYAYDNAKKELTIKGLEKNLIEEFSEIVIFSYKSIPNEFSENYFILEYYNYQTVYDYDTFLDSSYFESNKFIGYDLDGFNKLTISEDIDKEENKNNFRVSSKNIVRKVDVYCEIELIGASDIADMVQYAGNNEFRIVLINSLFGRIFLINNCRIDNGVSIIFQKEGNTKTCKLSCGNYIDIKIDSNVSYGKNKYGKGLYGGGTWVLNSHRREV